MKMNNTPLIEKKQPEKIKKKIIETCLFMAANTFTYLPCWNWSSRLIDKLVVADECTNNQD
jgi:hypothetical protein